AKPANFTSLINWGDGSVPSPGTIALDASNTYHVSGKHTYLRPGVFPIAVTVRDDSGGNFGGNVVGVASRAVVIDAGLTPQGKDSTPVEGNPFFGAVATFKDADPNATPGGFAALISWGDNTPPTPGVVLQPGGIGTDFEVRGLHTYRDEGKKTVSV